VLVGGKGGMVTSLRAGPRLRSPPPVVGFLIGFVVERLEKLTAAPTRHATTQPTRMGNAVCRETRRVRETLSSGERSWNGQVLDSGWGVSYD